MSTALAPALVDARPSVALAAEVGGWEPADALHATGYTRGPEALAVWFTEAGRVLHATYTHGDWDHPKARESMGVDEPGRTRLDFALDYLTSTR